MKTVKFLVGSGIYNAGEVASFHGETVDKLVNSKIVEVIEATVDEPKPAKPKAKAPVKPTETDEQPKESF